MGSKLTAAQRRILELAPCNFERPPKVKGIASWLTNPTTWSLRERKLIQIATVPLRWRITNAGRAALASATKGEG